MLSPKGQLLISRIIGKVKIHMDGFGVNQDLTETERIPLTGILITNCELHMTRCVWADPPRPTGST